jgi:hypothetical protein
MPIVLQALKMHSRIIPATPLKVGTKKSLGQTQKPSSLAYRCMGTIDFNWYNAST